MSALEDLEPKISDASKLMEMLSQPHRLKILCLLQEGEQSVLSLAKAAGLSQPAMSHHLKKLRDSEFVQTRRDAQTIYYSLRGREVSSIISVLHDLYCGAPGEKNDIIDCEKTDA